MWSKRKHCNKLVCRLKRLGQLQWAVLRKMRGAIIPTSVLAKYTFRSNGHNRSTTELIYCDANL